MAVIAAALLASARAETVLPVSTATGSEVTIKLSSPCLQAPRFGFVPVRISIENSASRERSWTFDFDAGSRDHGSVLFNHTVSVPAGQNRDVWVYVPIAEAGEAIGPPAITSGGLVPAARSPVASPNVPQVTISKSPKGTKVLIRRMAGSRPIMTEEIEIDETTGEVVRSTTSPSGFSSSSRNKPPTGSDAVYTIDPVTGFVSTRYTRGTGGPKVTVVTGSPPATPSGPATAVQIVDRPSGKKVTRTITLTNGQTYVEEQDIDILTGVITKTITPSRGAPTQTATQPLPDGTESTIHIDQRTGLVRTPQTRLGKDPTAPPKVMIVVDAAPATRPSPGRISFSSAGTPITLTVEVNGPGVPTSYRVQFPILSTDGGMRPIAASPNIERLLVDGLKAEGIATPNVSVVEPAQLPADWRVWSSFAHVLLSTDEYAALDRAHRGALRGWVAMGGRLLLLPADDGERVAEKCGVGEIVTLPHPLRAAPRAAELADYDLTLGGHAGHPDRDATRIVATGRLGATSERRPPATLWVSFFLVAFAVTVGPLNLFVFAPAAKRHRLFFTTPLISLVAVLVLVLAIFAQDGIGGQGARVAVVVLVPGANEAAVFQEQAARTGFLVRQSFPLADDLQASVLGFDDEPPTPFASRGLSYTRLEGTAGGAWYRSRSRQAQLLQRLVPTRGRVERAGAGPDGAPIVQSSLSVALRGFVFIDEANQLWTTPEVPPGRRVTLQRGGEWLGTYPLGGSRRFADVLAAAAPKAPGHWVARSNRFDLAPIETLSSIRWMDVDTMVTGTLELAGSGSEVAP